MASGRRERSCPICCEAPADIARALPCRHQFCLRCILRWLWGKRTCPLCRRLISTVSFSEQEEGCLQCIIAHRGQASSPAGGRDGSRAPQGTPCPAEQGAAGPAAVGGILPELWAELFRRRWNLLTPVRAWLQRCLQKIYGERWWKAKTAESSILLALCTFGPDREVLVQRLQPRLQRYTALLVQGVLRIIRTQCSREVRRLRGCGAARPAQAPTARPGPAAALGRAPASAAPPNSGLQHEASASEEALPGRSSPPATDPAEPEQPQEQQGRAAGP